MEYFNLLGIEFMAAKQESSCITHRWDRWQEPMVVEMRNEKGFENVLLQYRQCVECGLAESRRVL